MHHSASTPAGVDGGARTPPATPKKGGKMLAVRVQMLDDSISMFQIQAFFEYVSSSTYNIDRWKFIARPPIGAVGSDPAFWVQDRGFDFHNWKEFA
ncbi:jg5761 [Pararge aegeria aegeria]|uniref:Jg5761 protein n=1 Tax=Pararge aegeria aegeria TaxID=348720 RepID=A0A8S4SHU5_9NEOP|nr:jg5761 [Pararge aegeria aegeria]